MTHTHTHKTPPPHTHTHMHRRPGSGGMGVLPARLHPMASQLSLCANTRQLWRPWLVVASAPIWAPGCSTQHVFPLLLFPG